ncbi:MAG: histidine kinase [Pseudomonadota bacterium]
MTGGQILRTFAYTGAFCLAIGVVLWAIGVAEPLLDSILTSCCIGFSIWLTHAALLPLLEARIGWAWTCALATVIGLSLALTMLALFGEQMYAEQQGMGVSTPLLAVFFGVVGTAMFGMMTRADTMQRALAEAEIARLEQERRLSEERLKTLQAQIEPHFLFNTLSNVIGLVRSDPDAAEETLQQLTRLLRNSLSRTRTSLTTIGEELVLLEAYLRIAEIRMGDRLSFEIDCPAELRRRTLPPLLIQPLVENALRHGLETLTAGGSVTVRVRARSAVQASEAECDLPAIEIDVIDDGCGLDPGRPQGTGLGNIRERLRELYADAAALEILENAAGGVTARLSIPAERASAVALA